MRNKNTKLSQICLIVCAVLCLALIVTQFLPFWTVDGETLSIWGFLSFPEDHKNFTKAFEGTFGDAYSINSTAGTACMILGFGALTIIFAILKSDKSWTFVWPLVCGASTVINYLTVGVFQQGNGWILHLILGAVIAVLALVPAIGWIKGIKSWFVDDAVV